MDLRRKYRGRTLDLMDKREGETWMAQGFQLQVRASHVAEETPPYLNPCPSGLSRTLC